MLIIQPRLQVKVPLRVSLQKQRHSPAFSDDLISVHQNSCEKEFVTKASLFKKQRTFQLVKPNVAV
jgi:hypothetical protein